MSDSIEVYCHDGTVKRVAFDYEHILGIAHDVYYSLSPELQQRYTAHDYYEAVMKAARARVAGSEWLPCIPGIKWYTQDAPQDQLDQHISELPSDLRHVILSHSHGVALDTALRHTKAVRPMVDALVRDAHLAPVSSALWAIAHYSNGATNDIYEQAYKRAVHHIDHIEGMQRVFPQGTPWVSWFVVEARLRTFRVNIDPVPAIDLLSLESLTPLLVSQERAVELTSEYPASTITTANGVMVVAVSTKGMFMERVLGVAGIPYISIAELLSALIHSTAVSIHPEQTGVAGVLRMAPIKHTDINTLHKHIQLVRELI